MGPPTAGWRARTRPTRRRRSRRRRLARSWLSGRPPDVLIVDAHLDLAWNARQWRRDLTRPVAEIRAAEAGMDGPGRGRGTVALPELARGRVAVTIATVIARCTGVPEDGLDYETVKEAGAVARDQLAWYRAMESEGRVVVL